MVLVVQCTMNNVQSTDVKKYLPVHGQYYKYMLILRTYVHIKHCTLSATTNCSVFYKKLKPKKINSDRIY